MPKPTKTDLIRRAQRAVDRAEELALDVAAEEGLIFANVKGLPHFTADVANELIDSVNKWAHLEYVRPQEVIRMIRGKSIT
jgi:hypothetical protein